MGNKRKPFFTFVKGILKIFKRKPKITNENNTLEDGAIYLSNHSAASGPLIYELYFPKQTRFWGTYEMCENVRTRYKYLSTIYYPNKKHLPKWLSKIVAFVVLPFISGFYRGIQILPTYPDARLRGTLKESIKELENGKSIFIFPENSSDGYHKVLTEYFAGFFLLAKYYHKKTGKNLKIYNMYYIKKKNTILIKKATTYLDLVNTGKTGKEIAEMLKVEVNEMYANFLAETKKKDGEFKKEKEETAEMNVSLKDGAEMI